MAGDKIKWYPYFRVQKYGAETFDRIQQHLGHAPSNEELADLEMRGLFVPDGVASGQGNLMTDTGIKRLWACASGMSSALQMTSSTTFMGVGSSSTAAAGTDTDLIGTKAFDRVNSGPSVATSSSTDDAIQYSVQFGSGEAEHAWNEWCIGVVLSGTASATVVTSLASVGTGAVILNRAVSALGTKGAGSTWTLTAKITLN